MNLHELNVVVAGSAIGGAATAILLARAGARVTVFEKVARPQAVGAGIGLAENGLAVLEALGLGAGLTQAGRLVDGIPLVDARGRVLLQPRGNSPRLLMVRRSELYRLLLDALAAADVETCFGAEVTSAAPDGSVTAGGRSLRADLIIGADGVRSRIRDGGDFGASVGKSGISYVRGMAPAGLARGEEAWTPAGLFGSFAVADATYFYTSIAGAQARRALAAHDLAAFKAAWAEAYPPSANILAAIDDWSELLINEVIRVSCRRFYDRRLVLVGDAAHAMAPNLGQGANSALVDAAVLLDELRRASDLESALGAYDRRRRPAVERVATTAARLGALADRTHPVIRWLRDRILMPIAGRFTDERAKQLVLQESPATLSAITKPSPPPAAA